MRYLKKFENKVSIFDSNEWVKLLPKKLTVITDNGKFTLEVKSLEPELGYPGVYNLMNCVSFIYGQNTVEDEGGDVTYDGEPDNLQFDITMVKDNDGSHANPNSLRLNVDLTYGDHMQYSFTIDKPNKVSVHHYTGKNSLHDSQTYWGFTYESLQEIVDFFNRFGFETTIEDFKFMDEDPDSYQYEKPIEKGNRLEPMIMDDETKVEVDQLKGGDRIKKYNEFQKKTFGT